MTRLTRVSISTSVILVVAGLFALLFVPVQHAAPARPPTATSLGNGDEIVAIFIGASFCGATKVPDLPQVLESMKRSLTAVAAQEHERFVSVGVALDWSPEDGVKFLSHFGRFDEILAGRNWLNTGAVDYIWRGTPGAAGLPQVLVVQRHIDAGKTSITVGEDRLLRREVGADEIRTWVNMNTPIR